MQWPPLHASLHRAALHQQDRIFRGVENRPLQRIFAFVRILAILSLGGFGGRGNMHILNGPSLWEWRARNKGLMILKGKQAENYKTNK
jgi:hypothetical protein